MKESEYESLWKSFIKKWQPGFTDINGTHLNYDWEKELNELLYAQFKRTIELFSNTLIKTIDSELETINDYK